MKWLIKILLTLICVYAFIGSLYLFIYHIQKLQGWKDILLINSSNFIVLCCCIYLPLIAWNVVKTIKLKHIQIVILIIVLLIHFQSCVLEFFTRRAGVDYTKVDLLVGIPSFLSLFVVITLIVWLAGVQKSNSQLVDYEKM